MSEASYLRGYARELQRRDLDRARTEALAERIAQLNDAVLNRADAHFPLTDPATFRLRLLRYRQS